jgi:hypothetical protein
MKNKPDPALLRPSNLSNEIKKRVPKSSETIPLINRIVREKLTIPSRAELLLVFLCRIVARIALFRPSRVTGSSSHVIVLTC